MAQGACESMTHNGVWRVRSPDFGEIVPGIPGSIRLQHAHPVDLAVRRVAAGLFQAGLWDTTLLFDFGKRKLNAAYLRAGKSVIGVILMPWRPPDGPNATERAE